MSNLTSTRRVWAACSELALQHKCITVRRIQAMVGYRSCNTAHYQMLKLKDAGYLSKGERLHNADWVVKVPLLIWAKESKQEATK